MLNPLDHPVCLTVPDRICLSAWHTHYPFAMYLVDIIRPSSFVELGTHEGFSYCAICQAIRVLGLSTVCHAIDTWKGDEHAGIYGEEVFEDLAAYHDPLYGSFSTLLRSAFDDALAQFADRSIDLLHIDGLHTYEAVRHDFFSWLPKMSDRGVVLLHDTNVRERNFGVRRFWDEIRVRYPHFEFFHGHGLGILAVGEHVPEKLLALMEAGPEEASQVRRFFSVFGGNARARYDANKAQQALREAREKRAVAEQRTSELEEVVSGRDSCIRDLEAAIAQRDARVQELEGVITSRDAWVRDLEAAVADRDARLATVSAELEERSLLADSLGVQADELKRRIDELSGQLDRADRDRTELTTRVADRDRSIQSLMNRLADRDRSLAEQASQLEERFLTVRWLESEIATRDGFRPTIRTRC